MRILCNQIRCWFWWVALNIASAGGISVVEMIQTQVSGNMIDRNSLQEAGAGCDMDVDGNGITVLLVLTSTMAR